MYAVFRGSHGGLRSPAARESRRYSPRRWWRRVHRSPHGSSPAPPLLRRPRPRRGASRRSPRPRRRDPRAPTRSRRAGGPRRAPRIPCVRGRHAREARRRPPSRNVRRARSRWRAYRRQLHEAAQRVRQPHLLDGRALDLQEPRRAHQVGEALGARDGDVESVSREQEVEPARHVFSGGACHRVEDDRRLATLKLVDGADLDAVSEAPRAGSAPDCCRARRRARRPRVSGACAARVGKRFRRGCA